MSDDEATSPTRKARLNLLLRKQQGTAKRTRLQQILQPLPSGSWRLISLAESDILSESLLNTIRAARDDERLIRKGELTTSEFEAELTRLLTFRHEDEQLLVSLSDVSQVGLIEITVSALRDTASKLIEHDRDSMITTSREFNWGVIAQRLEKSERISYQIEAWG
ncbi:MAG TPA: hypothetical protein VE465_18100 [Streptosporangiaceae bacterium]|jgi:hypothetical protein|nr:hypothetical protein [Streptosporangiaceae bacterium]